jgi:hypothetical protein
MPISAEELGGADDGAGSIDGDDSRGPFLRLIKGGDAAGHQQIDMLATGLTDQQGVATP